MAHYVSSVHRAGSVDDVYPGTAQLGPPLISGLFEEVSEVGEPWRVIPARCFVLMAVRTMHALQAASSPWLAQDERFATHFVQQQVVGVGEARERWPTGVAALQAVPCPHPRLPVRAAMCELGEEA